MRVTVLPPTGAGTTNMHVFSGDQVIAALSTLGVVANLIDGVNSGSVAVKTMNAAGLLPDFW